MKKQLLLILALLVVAAVRAQDRFFLQSNPTLLSTSPSFAGSNGGVRVQSSTQSALSHDMSLISVDGYIPAMKAGIGVSWRNTIPWSQNQRYQSFDFTYAQYLELSSEVRVIPSLQASYVTTSYYPWSSELVSSTSFMDYSGGVLLNIRKDFYFGFTYNHFTRPNYEFDLGPKTMLLPRWGLYGSYNWRVGERNMMQVLARVDYQAAFCYYEFAVNTVIAKHLVLGAGTYDLSTYFANAGCRFNYFSISAAYGVATNLFVSSTNTFQLSASMTLRDKQNRKAMVNFENW